MQRVLSMERGLAYRIIFWIRQIDYMLQITALPRRLRTVEVISWDDIRTSGSI